MKIEVLRKVLIVNTSVQPQKRWTEKTCLQILLNLLECRWKSNDELDMVTSSNQVQWIITYYCITYGFSEGIPYHFSF